MDRGDVLKEHWDALQRELECIASSGKTYREQKKRERLESALGIMGSSARIPSGEALEHLVGALRGVEDVLSYRERGRFAFLVAQFSAATRVGSDLRTLDGAGTSESQETVHRVLTAVRRPPEGAHRGSEAPAVLILTAARVEYEAAIDLAGVRDSLRERRRAVGGHLFIDLGFPHCPVWLFLCKKGSVGPGAATTRTMEALLSLNPPPFAVIAAGVAFGLRPGKQTIGDVLVAEQIRLYEVERVGEKHRLMRGDRPSSSDLLLDWFRSCEIDWAIAQPANERPRVHLGLLMSGEKLVDDPDFVAKLCAIEPEAIGGEMEAAGVYSAAYARQTHWIVVKGICDWGMGKGDKHQCTAAVNALEYVFHVLEQPVMLDAVRALR